MFSNKIDIFIDKIACTVRMFRHGETLLLPHARRIAQHCDRMRNCEELRGSNRHGLRQPEELRSSVTGNSCSLQIHITRRSLPTQSNNTGIKLRHMCGLRTSSSNWEMNRMTTMALALPADANSFPAKLKRLVAEMLKWNTGATQQQQPQVVKSQTSTSPTRQHCP